MEDYTQLKIALISDQLTRDGLSGECKVSSLTPLNYKTILKDWSPDLLIVESCWEGIDLTWKGKIAKYSGFQLVKNNKKLKKLVDYAKELNIPTIFWNKEDGVHFSRFIDSAQFFDHIFTTDSNMLSSYNELCPNAKTIDALTFAINPRIHYPQHLRERNKFCFVGSYRRNLHPERKINQKMLLEPALMYGLDIYDRNSDRKGHEYRFPPEYHSCIKPKINYEKTGDIYNRYLGCLNVNTVTDSPTMFSRRVPEIIACQIPLISTNSLAMQSLFKDFIFTVESEESARDCLAQIHKGSDRNLKDKLRAGHEFIMKIYTYNTWLKRMLSCIGLA